VNHIACFSPEEKSHGLRFLQFGGEHAAAASNNFFHVQHDARAKKVGRNKPTARPAERSESAAGYKDGTAKGAMNCAKRIRSADRSLPLCGALSHALAKDDLLPKELESFRINFSEPYSNRSFSNRNQDFLFLIARRFHRESIALKVNGHFTV
jgi:hypothetical protein